MDTSVQLQPYAHQVTGHAGLMTTDDQVVIFKPVISNELEFYATMAPELRAFTPQFYGVADVTHRKVNGGLLCTADLPLRAPLVNPSDDVTTTSSSVQQSKVQYEGLERRKFETNGGFNSHLWTRDKDMEADVSGVGKNPWVVRLLNKAEDKLGRHDAYVTKPCLLLENVACSFNTPCIMDLKVGTRLYGDDCPSDKINRHYEKTMLTTTASLGLRLSGLQVYQDRRYVCRDKYFGRGLSSEGLYASLRLFLQHDNRVRTDVISPIVRMLESLVDVMNDLESYRLYGSSLIIMYEGSSDDAEDGGETCTDHKAERKENHLKLSENSKSNECSTLSSRVGDRSHDSELMKLRHNARVDVRLVDFAHCTYATLPGSGRPHDGPDAGCIFGLKNLIRLLERVQQEAT